MISKNFLEEYSLFRKKDIESGHEDVRLWDRTPINMHCKKCNSPQTFNMTNNFYEDGREHNVFAHLRVLDLRYLCQACQTFQRRFFVHVNEKVNTIYKVGQYPEWEIKMDKGLEKTLNNHASTFRKGLVCESQGYGIGAFSYYRRITEEVIDELLDSIYDLIEEEHKAKYKKALDETKKTRVAQDKIDLVKDLLPTILRPGGTNPLGVLHTELSEGLHAETDEACLENAAQVRGILTFLITQILQSRSAAKGFSDSMKSLLEKKVKM
ncbi:MAG: hypothetical protein JKY52_09735 [Flavobacteriales bacterium]|nr:hypothetical protein [Flavobacteriales bacterium]